MTEKWGAWLHVTFWSWGTAEWLSSGETSTDLQASPSPTNELRVTRGRSPSTGSTSIPGWSGLPAAPSNQGR